MKRAYASEPILFAVSPITSVLKPKSSTLTNFRWHVIAVAAAALLASGGTMGWLTLSRVQDSANSGIIPVKAQQSMGIPLYQPSWLPSGFRRSSINTKDQVLVLGFRDKQGRHILFSEQPKPPLFNFDDFYKKQFEDSKLFTTAEGQGAVGRLDGSLAASLATDRTWIFIRAPDAMNPDQLKQIVENLRPAEQS